MKTAQSIQEQEERKNARDNGQTSPADTPPVKPTSRRGDFSRIAKWAWKPGQSGNPKGVNTHPQDDLAAELARAIFENNPELIYKAFLKAISRGNAYAFQTLADRGYGKLKETIHAEISPFTGQSDEELIRRIREIEQRLGYPPSELEPKILPPEDVKKPN